jgi:hypothetical protein
VPVIISKNELELFGYVEYCYRSQPSSLTIHKNTSDDENCMYQTEFFASLEELLEKMKPEVLEEIKKANNADEVWISDICFQANFENIKHKGSPITVINKKDTTNQSLMNVIELMKIVETSM